jgi:hypothetical protein
MDVEKEMIETKSSETQSEMHPAVCSLLFFYRFFPHVHYNQLVL